MKQKLGLHFCMTLQNIDRQCTCIDLVIVISILSITGPQRKRKRTEHVLEEFVENIEKEKDERRKKEAKHQEIREQNQLDWERRHKEQIDVQKSLVSILQQFLK